jgi:HNH endonuclease
MITQEYLKSVLDYNQETGDFIWKQRPDIEGPWNKRYAGKVAGHRNKNGYVRIEIDDVPYWSHRLAWLWMTGEWPPKNIDHKDLIKGNTSWLNLRAATMSQNLANIAKRKDSNQPYKGVYFRKTRNRWEARIRVGGKKYYLGEFKTAEAAHSAYASAALVHFGEFARLD